MPGSLLTGNAAAAWGARLADVDYIPAFPITPQTEIIELLAAVDGGGSYARTLCHHGLRALDADRRRRCCRCRGTGVHCYIKSGIALRL